MRQRRDGTNAKEKPSMNGQTDGLQIIKIGGRKFIAITHSGLAGKLNEDRYLIKDMQDNCVLIAVADGLHQQIHETTLIYILNAATDLKTKAKSLVKAALDAGGMDNITLVMAQG
jgi:serine/threonine protein phosphatase PrpC